MTSQISKPLLVRLPNWIGDVVMVLPSLRLLASHGYALQLVGKSWARSLLAGEHWPVHAYPSKHRERVRLLKKLAFEARQQDPSFDSRPNAITFPNSFSSAWELRAAGLRACGYRKDMRHLLLTKSFELPSDVHQLMSYWQLAARFLEVEASPPSTIALQISNDAQAHVEQWAQAPQFSRGYIMLCPFAQGQLKGQSKKWPLFAEFARRAESLGLPLVVCPGPNEMDEARASFAAAIIMKDVNLADYAGLLQRASLVVANDTGPGHIAAGVGAPLLTVLGPTDPKRYGPWGTSVTVINTQAGWPTVDQVLRQAEALLAPIPSP